MNADNYTEIINGIDTYKQLAKKLKDGQSVIIGWTDKEYTHLDLLFNYRAYKEGNLQRGLRGNELYVSIIGIGAFGFNIFDDEKVEWYIAEKLNIQGEPTTRKLAELINNVIKEINK